MPDDTRFYQMIPGVSSKLPFPGCHVLNSNKTELVSHAVAVELQCRNVVRLYSRSVLQLCMAIAVELNPRNPTWGMQELGPWAEEAHHRPTTNTL